MIFKLLSPVRERLSEVDNDITGGLYGVITNNTMIVTTLSFDSPEKSGVDSYLEMQTHFPAGVDFCGCFAVISSSPPPNEYITNNLKEVQVTDNPIYLERNVSDGELVGKVLRDGRLMEKPFIAMSLDEFSKQFISIRVSTSLSTSLGPNATFILDDSKKFMGDGIFQFEGTETYIYGDDDSDSKSTLREMTASACVFKDPRIDQGVVGVELLQPLSASLTPSAPSFCITPQGGQGSVVGRVVGMCLAEGERGVAQLYGLLTDSVYRHLQLLDAQVARLYSDPADLASLRTHHFLPPSFPHTLTFLLPANSQDHTLRGVREELHRQLGLGRDVPLLRRGNALVLAPPPSRPAPLIAPHQGLPSPVMEGATVGLVSGLYSYYHYMQDDYNDQGWGCAYRSLQTLFSWFRWQGYTERGVPTHAEIQQTLVSIGDKPKSLVGSKEWIGSAEVGYVLNTLIGVTTMTLSVGSGSGMSGVAADLARHFTLHGTPVMIGGGNLAHTILGVQYTDTDTRYLVLDPHYTGAEDLRTIRSKGWLAWKNTDFWKKNSFYNMCLPLRPRTI